MTATEPCAPLLSASVTHFLAEMGHWSRQDVLPRVVTVLQTMCDVDQVLVFVDRSIVIPGLVAMLRQQGVPLVDGIYGQVAPLNRERICTEFREGRTKVLVTTNLLAIGLDVPQVGAVVHFSNQMTPELYTRRTGRVGRNGAGGVSVLLNRLTSSRRNHHYPAPVFGKEHPGVTVLAKAGLPIVEGHMATWRDGLEELADEVSRCSGCTCVQEGRGTHM
jgi:superfamily II DNA/RNA helicase